MGLAHLVTSWTDTDLAYFAGIIDGEGCFAMHQQPVGHVFALQLQIGNTSPQLMEWIRSKFGGSVNLEKRNNPRHKPVFRWLATADSLDAIVPAIIPFLVVKKAQAELFLAYRRTLGPKVKSHRSTYDTPLAVKRERARIHSEIRVLNQRGIAVNH